MSNQILLKGMWLPGDFADFFDPINDVNQNLIPVGMYQDEAYRAFVTSDPQDRKPNLALQSSVYNRLWQVLPRTIFSKSVNGTSKTGNAHVYPLFSVSSTQQPLHRYQEPSAVLWASLPEYLDEKQWGSIRSAIKAIFLYVDNSGFYQWAVLYDPLDQSNEIVRQTIERVLDQHIYTLVGGDFYAQSASPSSTPDTTIKNTEGLVQYCEERLGILSYSQLNYILEGLYNSTFDPRIFFDIKESKESVAETYAEYAIGTFIKQIYAAIELSDDEISISLIKLALGSFDVSTLHEVHSFFLQKDVRLTLLHQFMLFTGRISFQLLQWRIESCRRAIFITMVENMQRGRQISDITIPTQKGKDLDSKGLLGLLVNTDSYTIESTNSNRLRGYVILLGAKLPLLGTIRSYLNNTIHYILPESNNVNDDKTVSELKALHISWNSHVETIQKDLAGLEDAINQLQRDEQNEETKRIREEQEILADMARVQDRTNISISPGENLAISAFANLMALVAVVLSFSQLQDLITNALPLPLLIPALILVVILGFFLLQWVITKVTTWFTSRITYQRRQSSRYYYELAVDVNIVLNAEDEGAKAEGAEAKAEAEYKEIFQRVFFANFNNDRLERLPDKGVKAPKIKTIVQKHKPERSAYRVDQSRDTEADHKIYVQAVLYWPQPLLRKTRWLAEAFPKKEANVWLVYEFPYLRKAETTDPATVSEEFGFKDVRAVITSGEIFKDEDIFGLEQTIVECFINSLIPEKDDKKGSDKENGGRDGRIGQDAAIYGITKLLRP